MTKLERKHDMGQVFNKESTANLLDRIAGLDQPGGDARLKPIVRDLMAAIFRIVEDHAVTESELWHAIAFLGEAAPELGLIVPGVGLEHYMDRLLDAADAAQGVIGGTPRTIEGPLFVEGAPLTGDSAVMSDNEDAGERLTVSGMVHDGGGNPVAGAIIDVWHADTRGFYSHFDPTGQQGPFNNRRKIRSGSDGRYSYSAIMPVGYSVPPGGTTERLMQALGRHGSRPAHIHYFVRAEGYRHLTTQINIADDPLVHDDFAFATRDELIPALDRGADGATISFNIELVASGAADYALSDRVRVAA
jgi:catechol 1,2-dioxygenase